MRFILALATLVTFTSPAYGYYAILDNAEVLPEGHYKLTGDLQAITDAGGLNAAARIDAGFQDEFGVRGLVGFGVTDFFLGGFFKWVPIPDVSGQPAIGMNAGVLFATDDGDRDLTFRLEPLVSKHFKASKAVWTPYGSLPLGFRTRNSARRGNSSDVTFQVVAGTQLQVERWQNLQFMAEIGVDLHQALSHVSIAAVLYFDEENGIKLK